MKYALFFTILIGLYTKSFGQSFFYENTDPRYIGNGVEIPSETFADLPNVVICNDGSWLSVITTSQGLEYAFANYIISSKSYDQGKSWTDPIYIEPPLLPQASFATLLKTPGGRIYAIYNYNEKSIPGDVGVMCDPFVFKYSDDNGETWSKSRYHIPVRKTKIDYDNACNGVTQFFLTVDKPIVTKDCAFLAFTKFLPTKSDYARSEGFVLRSKNILYEKDPEKIVWETLPEGDEGISNPEYGNVQTEHNIVELNNGDLYVVYRTTLGFPAYSVSKDGGKSFSKPQTMSYSNGKAIGNPRACPKIHKTRNGKYLFWFHNNFQKSYDGRNPVWISGGIEKDGGILWSQPEIVLFDVDQKMLGMSYPDFIEENGRLWITETQKDIARIHEMDFNLIKGMWRQGEDSLLVRKGLVMDAGTEMFKLDKINFPGLPDLFKGEGCTIELWATIDSIKHNQIILSTFGFRNKGIEISLKKGNSVGIRIHDGHIRENSHGIDGSGSLISGQEFISDVNTIIPGKKQHLVFILDGAAKVVSILVDGVLSDGDIDTRAYGWGQIYPYMKDLNDSYKCSLNPSFKGKIHQMRVYNRYLRTSEAISNYHAGCQLNGPEEKN